MYDVSKKLYDDIKTRVAYRFWDKLGRSLLTVRAVSGIHVA